MLCSFRNLGDVRGPIVSKKDRRMQLRERTGDCSRRGWRYRVLVELFHWRRKCGAYSDGRRAHGSSVGRVTVSIMGRRCYRSDPSQRISRVVPSNPAALGQWWRRETVRGRHRRPRCRTPTWTRARHSARQSRRRLWQPFLFLFLLLLGRLDVYAANTFYTRRQRAGCHAPQPADF